MGLRHLWAEMHVKFDLRWEKSWMRGASKPHFTWTEWKERGMRWKLYVVPEKGVEVGGRWEESQRICAREGEKGGSACLIWNGCYSDHTPGCQLWHGSLLRPTPKWQIKDTPQWPSSLSSSPLALSLSLFVSILQPSFSAPNTPAKQLRQSLQEARGLV